MSVGMSETLYVTLLILQYELTIPFTRHYTLNAFSHLATVKLMQFLSLLSLYINYVQ